MHVVISDGNIKVGEIKSVSLPPGETCPDCPCKTTICYARRMDNRLPNVHKSYQNNLKCLIEEPDTYWREVEAAIMTSRFFRFHVSGDIPNENYLLHMIQIASRNSHCEIMCFTKRYDFVNKWISLYHFLPTNLHIIFSVWRDYPCPNPYSLPEAHVRYKDGFTTASPDAIECNGNCTECATTNGGCWTLDVNEQVVFNQH